MAYQVKPLEFPQYERDKYEFAVIDDQTQEVAGHFAKEKMASRIAKLLNAEVAAGSRGPGIGLFRLAHDGVNPFNYWADADRTGDPGLYEEVRIGVHHPDKGCVADVLVGLDQNGDPRVLITHNGEGDGDPAIAVFPLKPKETAVDIFGNY